METLEQAQNNPSQTQDWFAANAPQMQQTPQSQTKAASGDDWFAKNAPNAQAQDENIGAIHKGWNWLWGIGPQYEHQGLVEQFQNSMDKNVQQVQREMEQGKVNPRIGSVATFGGGVLRDMAKTERVVASPGNVAAGTAAALVPPLRAPIGAYYAIQGAKDALTPQQPGETLPDEVQRRLGGAGTALLAGAGTAESLPRKAYIDKYETWRDNNFDKDGDSYTGESGQKYTEAQLQQMHQALADNLAKTPTSSLFAGIQRQLADYKTWRDTNFRPGANGGWESPSGQLLTDEALHSMYDARASVQTSVVKGIQQTLSDATSKTGSIVRNNPVTNVAIGPNPEAIPADAAFIKATKPRNSIQDINEHVNRGLPDAVRAANNLGIDTSNMTLRDAETAVTQAKKDVWDEFTQNHLAPNASVVMDTSGVADAISAVGNKMTAIQQRRMPGIVNDIKDNAADYSGQTMTVGQIEDRIQELNNELRSQQATFKVNEMNLRRDPNYAHKFAELDALRELESQAFGEMNSPDAADLKQRYGSLKVLQDVIDRRINVAERQNPVGLYEGMGRGAGFAKMAQGGVQTLLLNPKEGLPNIVEGAALATRGTNLQKLNNPDFLISQAFSKTAPREAPDFSPQRGGSNIIPPKGALPPGPVITPPPADTSGSVPYTPPPVDAGTRASRFGLLLPEKTATPLPQSSIPPEGEGVLPAQKIIVRDPATGKAKTMYGSGTGPTLYQMQAPKSATAVKETPQGGHAGNAVSSAEELSRPGQNYVVSKGGNVTFQGKAFAPENIRAGSSHVTVMQKAQPGTDEFSLGNGYVYRVNSGQRLSPMQESALRNAVQK
jgi:hypothetical protein